MVRQLAACRPPRAFVEVESWVLDSTAELSGLRAGIQRAMCGGDHPGEPVLPDVPEKMVLVASELATNALRHAAPPTTVQLARAGSEYLLDVADPEPTSAPVIETGREAGAGGLGLQLAERLSVDVGWYAEGDVKHVWATFPAGHRSASGGQEARSA